MDTLDDFNMRQEFKNGTTSLILGIASIVVLLFSCCLSIFGPVLGLILGIVGYFLANQDLKSAIAAGHDPTTYSNYSNLNTGKIMSLISIVLNALMLVLFVIILIIYGAAILMNPELLVN